jgi:capsule biosynthesis phosphatase
MIQKKCLVVDIDGTLCPTKQPLERYEDLEPYAEIVDMLRRYSGEGFHIILATSRSMRTYEGNMGLILANTAPVLLDWLRRHQVPYDELHFGKPWPGEVGFYVDDRAIRPSEFRNLTLAQISELLENEKTRVNAGS